MRTIVVVSDIPWTALFQRPQALATEFAKTYDRVVFVEPWHPSGQKIVPLPENVERVRLWYWPFNARIPLLGRQFGRISVLTYRIGDTLNRYLLKRAVGPAPDVIFSESPQQGNLLRGWPYTTVVFDYIDKFEGFVTHPTWVNNAFITALMRADVRIATHKGLADESMAHAVVGQGADTIFRDIYSKSVGIYWGYISEYMDWEEVLKYCNMGVVMVLVGPVKHTEIPEHENLFHLATVTHRALPLLARFADFGFIFWKQTLLTETVSPVKLQEYKMAGLKVRVSEWMVEDEGPHTWDQMAYEIIRLIDNHKHTSGAE